MLESVKAIIPLLEETICKLDAISNVKSISKSVLNDLLQNQNFEALKLMNTISLIGRHERGYQYSSDSAGGESIEIVIEVKILETQEELIEKYSRYLVYKKKEDLINYLLSNYRVHQSLTEGYKILQSIN